MAGIPLPVGANSWQDASYVRQAGSGRLVACYVAATLGTDASGNEDTGSLAVVRYDDANPPQPGTPQVIETGLVSAGKLLTRPDGTLGLFYSYDYTSLRHRTSRNGGATWSAASVIYSSAGPVCGTDVGAPFNTPPYTTLGVANSLHPVFAPQAGLFYVWYRGEFYGTGIGHLLVGSLAADGMTWNWTAPVNDSAPDVNPQLDMPQALRDGSLLLHRRAAWAHGLTAGGSYLSRPSYGASWNPTGPTWLHEPSGLWATASYPSGSALDPAFAWGISRGRLDSDLVIRAGTNAASGVSLPGWGASPTARGQRVGQMGVRKDRTWEFLFAQPSGELDFKRCASVPLNETGATSGMVWS